MDSSIMRSPSNTIEMDAIAHYLGETPPDSVAQMATRLTTVENRLLKMQKLFLGEG
ncbi:MAG: hypothetical protein AAGD25_29290 [Cyanobacteria bacterium P01_F01_bin.150]